MSQQAMQQALHDAATSLETIASLAGRKTHGDPPIETFMDAFADVRLYAAARAKVAREAIATLEKELALQQGPECQIRFDGNSVQQWLGEALFDFQQATGCDTAEEFLAAGPATRGAVERCHLLDELIQSWREKGNAPEQCERRIRARAAVEAAWPVIEANDAKDAALADLAAAVKFQDQVREGAKLGEQVTGTGIARDAREWIDRAARAVVAAMSTHQPRESGK